ncbi:hypothetical protein CY34DRAFT_426235 [Suillus luteus UH-Slu-Lm8-n1]|uniref:Uncharacterized protein n=1 Tax=Suillus luteus UH-Slu-Lm8-n1 TaxID=930992 RepID=A0A0D0AU39_9AGAM|nr:hypothetical protein CY34DRAFT_426235 [Suillus luteus UH-Slu-Lm8-n1]
MYNLVARMNLVVRCERQISIMHSLCIVLHFSQSCSSASVGPANEMSCLLFVYICIVEDSDAAEPIRVVAIMYPNLKKPLYNAASRHTAIR